MDRRRRNRKRRDRRRRDRRRRDRRRRCGFLMLVREDLGAAGVGSFEGARGDGRNGCDFSFFPFFLFFS